MGNSGFPLTVGGMAQLNRDSMAAHAADPDGTCRFCGATSPCPTYMSSAEFVAWFDQTEPESTATLGSGALAGFREWKRENGSRSVDVDGSRRSVDEVQREQRQR